MLKLLLCVGILCTAAFAEDENASKNYTRSRYSHRRNRTTTTTTAEPSTTVQFETTSSESSSSFFSAASDVDSTVEKVEAVATTAGSVNTDRPIKVYHCGAEHAHYHPWIAILEHTNPEAPKQKRKNKKTLSKGVLIHPQYVLTTVSSIHNSHPFWTVSSVRFGDAITLIADNIPRNRSHTQTIEVEEVFMHKDKDIALIKLIHDVQLTDFVIPVCLPINENYNFRELTLHVCKRSKQGGKKLAKSKVALVPVSPLSPQDCHMIYHRNQAEFSKSEFCAWDEAGDTCTGDMGGPLIAKQNGAYHLIGLKSYAQSKGPLKEQELPGVYSRVGVHLKWIKQIIAEGDDNEDRFKQWVEV